MPELSGGEVKFIGSVIRRPGVEPTILFSSLTSLNFATRSCIDEETGELVLCEAEELELPDWIGGEIKGGVDGD